MFMICSFLNEHRVMRSIDQPAFDFIKPLPRRPEYPERLFLGLMADDLTKARASRVGNLVTGELDLIGRQLDPERYHTTVIHLSDRKRIRSKDEYAAELAAKAVACSPFEIVFTRLGSFPGAPRKDRPLEHPLVLLAEDGPVSKLRSALARELLKSGYRAPETFRPHMTISYNRQFVPARPIEPIVFKVTELVLIHSRLWLKEYHILQRWPLRLN